MKGFDKFENALMTAINRLLAPWVKTKKKRKLVKAEIRKHVFDTGPPTPPGKPTGRQEYLRKLFFGFREISVSLDMLKDIEFYIGRFPYRSMKITKERHLQFHAEAYLHEVYVLEQRLLLYLKVIERQHRGDPRLPVIKDECDALRPAVLSAWRELTGLRSQHVHRVRFSDTDIERLIAIRLYIRLVGASHSKFAQMLQALYRTEYVKSRRGLKKWIASSNAATQEILDLYFDALFPAVFNDKGKVRYPNRLKL